MNHSKMVIFKAMGVDEMTYGENMGRDERRNEER